MKRRTIKYCGAVILLLFSGTTQTFSQLVSAQGWFEVDFGQGCAPLQINVNTSIPESQVPLFQFFGKDDPNPVAWRDSFVSLPNTYTAPGTYTIYLTIQIATVIRQDSAKVTVFQSEIPDFDLKQCDGNGILVEINDSFYDSYIVDFGDGNSTTVNSGDPPPTHLYSTSQSRNVSVTGRLNNAPNNCGSDTKLFVPEPALLAPFISYVQVDSSEDIYLQFTLPQNVNYRLEVALENSQNFQYFADLNFGDTDITILDFTPDLQRYCFLISALNPCGGLRVESNIVCTNILDLEFVNNQNNLSWTTIETGTETGYQISRNAVPNYITLPSGTFTFNDIQVFCETQYCYSVTTIYNNGAQSISRSLCGLSFSTDIPPAVDNMAIDVLASGVSINWDINNSNAESYIDQFTPGDALLQRDTSDLFITFFTTNLNLYPQTCYVINYRDVCGNISPATEPICSIFLIGTSNPDGSIQLQWTEYVGLKDSISNYTIQKYDLDGTLFESIPVGTALQYVDLVGGTLDQIVTYIIEATPVDNQFQPIHSNSVEAVRRPQLIFPNSFTPNGDGLNDEFRPKSLFIKSYNLQIYNRWGEKIFSSDILDEGWDGTIGGQNAIEESYTYLAKAEDFRGLKISRSGIVHLIRN